MPKAPTATVVSPATRTAPIIRTRRLRFPRPGRSARESASAPTSSAGSTAGPCCSSIAACFLDVHVSRHVRVFNRQAGGEVDPYRTTPGRYGAAGLQRGEERGDAVVLVGAGDVGS